MDSDTGILDVDVPLRHQDTAIHDDDEDAPPSDGGGSDYEPDEPVRFGRGNKSRKKVSRRDSDGDSSGEEWGKKKGIK